MKPGAIFLNTSRGGLVDEAAFCEVMKSGRLFGAGLDVFRIEPLPVDDPLQRLENVLLCTHTGGLDHESLEGMGYSAARKRRRFARRPLARAVRGESGCAGQWRW